MNLNPRVIATTATFYPYCQADVIEWGKCYEYAAYALKVGFEAAELKLCTEHTAEMRRVWPEAVIEVATLRPLVIDVGQ